MCLCRIKIEPSLHSSKEVHNAVLERDRRFFAAEIFKEEQYLREGNPKIVITDKQTEILARLFLPEIKRYFADETVRKDFKEWEQTQQQEKLAA